MEKVSTQKSYLIDLATKIKKEYDFNDYEITAEKLKEITQIMAETIDKRNLKPVYVDEFFTKLHSGNLGMFYKQPISFLSVWQQYVIAKQVIY
jgi:hypothetical protein